MSIPPQDEKPSPARLPGQPPVIYCSQCGKQNPYGANFCAWCHAPIAYRDAPPVAQSPYPPAPPPYPQYQPAYPPMPYAAKPPRSPIVTIIGALLLVFLVMCVALSAIGYFSSNKGITSLGTNRNTSTQQQATPQPAVARSTVRLSGSGIKNTESFQLEGDYAVSWTATDNDTSHVGCYHGADLQSTDKSVFVFESLGNDMVDGGKSKTGTSNLYNLAPATYYVAVSSGCSWTITFTPH